MYLRKEMDMIIIKIKGKDLKNLNEESAYFILRGFDDV